MPLVFGIPTFDRVRPHPPAPWSDLCSLLSDCIRENVVLVIDDRMRLIEECAAHLETHRNDIPTALYSKLSNLLNAVHSSPQSRILIEVPVEITTAHDAWRPDLACAVASAVGWRLDFEYAFPRSADALDRAAAAPSVAVEQRRHGSEEEHSGGLLLHEMMSPTEQTITEDPGVPILGRASPNALSLGDARAPSSALGTSVELPIEITSGGDPVLEPVERALDLIWLGAYQESETSDNIRLLRDKTSFGSDHDFAVLATTLGRAMRFADSLKVYDGLFGRTLQSVSSRSSYTKQPPEVQRLIDAMVFYSRLWQHVSPRNAGQTLLLVTYGKAMDGPSRVQKRHFEQLVSERSARPSALSI